MPGDAAQDVTDVKAEDENDTNPTIIPRNTDDDINRKMLSRPQEPGTKAARYSDPPRGGKMLSFRPGSFEAFHATVIEPNKEAIDRILVEYNKSVHILDQRNDVQFFEKYHKQYTSGYLDDFGRPRTNFNLRPDKALDIHIGFLCTPKKSAHDCEAQQCLRLYAACFIAWHGPSFRYFFSKSADTDENPSQVFFSMPRNARITVKF
ncbi:hypothetical protein BFJ72_g9354 [Fusarium proliferatum]|uniref:Uncharacterized protein n=1 Tax=Gibberella intermedia TaxID=948311 RepID=A0A420SZL9_GIBIN|nr:hypothetical protein BFJ72_g9354 [Fusarium proliferatum]